MNYQKGFAVTTLLFIVLGVAVLGGAGYLAVNPEALQTLTGAGVEKENNEQEVAVNTKSSIVWRFAEAGETDGIPHTRVTVLVNNIPYEAGTFEGSCGEIGASGGVDGTGLLAGELSAVQCWFAGGGNEVGVFAHEDGGFDILVGELGEGEEGAGLFRGDFTVKYTIPL